MGVLRVLCKTQSAFKHFAMFTQRTNEANVRFRSINVCIIPAIWGSIFYVYEHKWGNNNRRQKVLMTNKNVQFAITTTDYRLR